MELNQVKEFIALTKTENYLEAAENLFISQSSLSKHIKSLEAELGTTLFDRTTRQVKLNEVGKVFLKYTQQLIDVRYQCNTALINLKDAEEQSLTIGSIKIEVKPPKVEDEKEKKRTSTWTIICCDNCFNFKRWRENLYE